MGMKELGELIKEARRSAGLTGDGLADAIKRNGDGSVGLTADKISRIETGTRKEVPGPTEIGAIARALEIPQFRMLQALGYDVGPQIRGVAPQDAEIERLVELLRQAKLDSRERWWVEDLLTSIRNRKAILAAAPE